MDDEAKSQIRADEDTISRDHIFFREFFPDGWMARWEGGFVVCANENELLHGNFPEDFATAESYIVGWGSMM